MSEVEGKRIDPRGACAQAVMDLCERSDDHYDQWCRESGHGETSRGYRKARAEAAEASLATLQSAIAEKDAEIERLKDENEAAAREAFILHMQTFERARAAEASLACLQADRDGDVAKAVAAEREACARAIENSELVHTSSGDLIQPRRPRRSRSLQEG